MTTALTVLAWIGVIWAALMVVSALAAILWWYRTWTEDR